MTKRRFRPKLGIKLVLSYLVLAACITCSTLFAGRVLQRSALRSALADAEVRNRTARLATMANSATEEAYAYVLKGAAPEKQEALLRIGEANRMAFELSATPGLEEDERIGLHALVQTLRTLERAAIAMFEDYEQSREVSTAAFQTYDVAIDDVTDHVARFANLMDRKAQRDMTSAGRAADWFAILVGLAMMIGAAAAGVVVVRRVTRPILALRDAARAFGAGDLDVTVEASSSDEIGELGEAFEKMAADTRRHIARRLEDIFASINEALVVCDREGIITLANPSCARLSGRNEAELVGQPYTVLFDVIQTEREEMAQRDVAGTLVTSAGRSVPVRISMSPLSGGKSEGYVLVARDLTDQHRLEAELHQAQKMEAIGRLAGGVAHDFNNMLTVILGATDMMLDEVAPSDPLHELLTEVKCAGDRSADLTRQLLAFSRQHKRELAIIEVNDVIDNASKMISRVLGEDVRLETSLSTETCHIEVEPGQLEQILMNLAVNARDAMPSGGKLMITSGTLSANDAVLTADASLGRGPYVTVTVRDDGTGMDDATRERIFEPFFTTKEQGKGTGLGLSTVFAIVQRAKGQIRIESRLGEGTTFKLYFPAKSLVAAKTVIPPALAARAQAETILVVEDEEQVRSFVTRALRRAGFNVLTAADPTDALLICETHLAKIDLMVTDVVMPQMSGRALADRALALRDDMRVLYMSGYTNDIVLDHGVREGVSFLQKPISVDALLRRVHALLDEAIHKAA